MEPIKGTQVPSLAEPKAPREEGIPGLKSMTDVPRENINWIWYPYIPAGKLTMLEGDPGLGKSWISCDITARLSTGRPFPGEEKTRIPAKVLMLSAEDGLGDTLRPRLETLGADLGNIVASDAAFTLDDKGIKALEYTMSRVSAAIVFIDPVVGYLGGKIDMHKANEVRGFMAALHHAATRTGAAIVGVRHLRKAQGRDGPGKAIYSGIGSIDFTAAARSALQVQQTKRGQTYMAHIKHNLSPGGEALAYSIADGGFQWTGTVNWDKERSKDTSTTRRGEAEEFLKRLLAHGPLPNDEVLILASEQGINEASLVKAKRGIARSRKAGKEWVWELTPEERLIQAPRLPNSAEHDRSVVAVDPAILEEALSRLGRGNG